MKKIYNKTKKWFLEIREEDKSLMFFFFSQILSLVCFYWGVVGMGATFLFWGCFALLGEFLTFFQKKEFTERGPASLKNVLWGLQFFLKKNQVFFFLSVIAWIGWGTSLVYGGVATFFAVLIFLLFYFLFYLLEKENIPALQYVILGFFVAYWTWFVFQPNPWNSIFVTFMLYALCVFKDSEFRKEIQAPIEEFNAPKKILDTHLTEDLLLFKVLKTQAIVLTISLAKLQYVWGVDVGLLLKGYFILKIFTAFKFVVHLSLLASCLVDLHVMLGFNTPVDMSGSGGKLMVGSTVGTFVAVAVGVTNEIVQAGVANQADVTNRAISTRDDPGREDEVRREQLRVNNFTSETSHGNLVGTTVKLLTGKDPYKIPGTTDIDLGRNLDLLKNKLATKEQAEAASFRLKTKCTSIQEAKELLESQNSKKSMKLYSYDNKDQWLNPRSKLFSPEYLNKEATKNALEPFKFLFKKQVVEDEPSDVEKLLDASRKSRRSSFPGLTITEKSPLLENWKFDSDEKSTTLDSPTSPNENNYKKEGGDGVLSPLKGKEFNISTRFKSSNISSLMVSEREISEKYKLSPDEKSTTSDCASQKISEKDLKKK